MLQSRPRLFSRRHTQLRVVCMAKVWRPLLDDIERLSRGDGAKVRGTGCRDIPHRLNLDERPVYDAAKKKGYMAVRGTGYRRARRGNPLPNIFRQWADAKGVPCIVIEQDMAGDSGEDVVVIDLAPLRILKKEAALHAVRTAAASLGARELSMEERPAEAVPFNCIPFVPPEKPTKHAAAGLKLQKQQQAAAGTPAGSFVPTDGASSSSDGSSSSVLSASETSTSSQSSSSSRWKSSKWADVFDDMPAEGTGEQAGTEVEEHKHAAQSAASQGAERADNFKLALTALQDAATDAQSGGSSSGVEDQAATGMDGSMALNADAHASSHTPSECDEASPAEPASRSVSSDDAALKEDHPYAFCAVWQLTPEPLFFSAPRGAAKALAEAVRAVLDTKGGAKH